ncbi:hypothetical protein [Roseateles sp. LYH14W]|uniref:Helicase ATP-binding domain-containing protein n=1 Tax=Pelomonas parva TaxID=3299032 RepID=A0ABW7FAG2_9BURK
MTSAGRALLDPNLLEFQRRTIDYAHQRMFVEGQRRFLVADEVGLGKTKVAQGVIALATAGKPRNVLYLASSSHIVGQNLRKLATGAVVPAAQGSLSLLAMRVHGHVVQGELIGLTPIKDLRGDHFGSAHERALLYRLLWRKHRALMAQPRVRKMFQGRAKDVTFDGHFKTAIPPSLYDDFERHLPENIVQALSDRTYREKHRRLIVGGLRAALARCALEKLDPAIVVVDEIQRFSSDLMAGVPTPQVAYMLERPLLVLSATPYQADAPSGEPEPHKGFMDLVGFLNHGVSGRAARVRAALKEMEQSLQDEKVSRERVAAAAGKLEKLLRLFMARTERPHDAHVERVVVNAALDKNDLAALRQAIALLKAASPSTKDRRHRFAEFFELWKSTPYLLSALGDKYAAGRDIRELLKKGPRRLRAPSALTVGQLERNSSLGDIGHPRLRALIGAMGRDAQDHRLWLAPTVPYICDPDRIPGVGPSKTLVFTSWSAAPPAIATALNLHAELRPSGKKKDLKFSRISKRTGVEETVRSTYVLAAPLWRFAGHSDPFVAMRGAGHPLDTAEMVARVRRQLLDAKLLKVSPAAKGAKSVETAVALNAGADYPPPSGRARSTLQAASDLMAAVGRQDSASVTPGVASELAMMAAAAPGTCAYRALRRAVPGLGRKPARGAWLSAALRIGSSIVRLFQRPAAVAIVEASFGRSKADYWQKVLRFCLVNDLQSVLDEYLFLLARDSSEKNPSKVAMSLAESVEVALSTAGGLHVVRPRPSSKEQPASRSSYGVAMFARSLGEHDSFPDEDAKPTRAMSGAGPHGSPLLAAFNSPFPPFVLTTTSTGQEGLDMHRYCRRLAHWNLPVSPLALEQREGRIDRYLSLGVRTNIAKLELPVWKDGSQVRLGREGPWHLLLGEAGRRKDAHASMLAPYWHFGAGQPIKALAINVPFSREETTWERLQEEASWYRLVLGQPDPRRLLERLANGDIENQRQIAGLRLDLAPRPKR